MPELTLAERLEAAQTDPIVYERLRASLVGYQNVPDQTWHCKECRRELVQEPDSANPLPADGFITRDRVRSGDRPKIGHIHVCRECCFDPVKALARMRRRRSTKSSGNFIDD